MQLTCYDCKSFHDHFNDMAFCFLSRVDNSRLQLGALERLEEAKLIPACKASLWEDKDVRFSVMARVGPRKFKRFGTCLSYLRRRSER